MGYIYTGEKGTPLRDILLSYYDQDFDVIECRCKWEENGEKFDELFGYCQYINGGLKPLDGDSYSLDDRYTEWEAGVHDNGQQWLTVWEDGRYSEVWE